MTTCPIFLKPFCLGTSKHDRAKAGKIGCVALCINVPEKRYYHGHNRYK